VKPKKKWKFNQFIRAKKFGKKFSKRVKSNLRIKFKKKRLNKMKAGVRAILSLRPKIKEGIEISP